MQKGRISIKINLLWRTFSPSNKKKKDKNMKRKSFAALSQFFLYLRIIVLIFYILHAPLYSNTSTPRGLIIYSVELKEFFFSLFVFHFRRCWCVCFAFERKIMSTFFNSIVAGVAVSLVPMFTNTSSNTLN